MRRLPTEYIETRKEYILFKNDCGVSDMTRRGGIYEHYIFDYIRDNIDIKGKIPEPTTKISPWLNTTIEPDTDTKNQKLCY